MKEFTVEATGRMKELKTRIGASEEVLRLNTAKYFASATANKFNKVSDKQDCDIKLRQIPEVREA